MHTDIQNRAFARVNENGQQRTGKDEYQRGHDGAEAQREKNCFPNALPDAVELARAGVLRDKGRKAVGEILCGGIGERVNLDACRESRHRCDAEAVDKALNH